MAKENRLDTLLETPEPAGLGPGPRDARKSVPELNRALEALGQSPPIALIRALVLLWHGHLDEAHSLAQDVPTPDGSFVHGIMHRREPDYGNAKYWFHRVGRHAAFPAIARGASAIPTSPAERALLARFCRGDAWDPFVFIDCCEEEAAPGSANEMFLRRVQKAEFSALLRHLADATRTKST